MSQELDEELDELITDQSPKKVFGFAVPEGTLRVRVVDNKGNVRWRKIDEVKDDDAADLSPEGQPLFQSKPVGRPPKTELHDVMPPATKLVGDLIKVKSAQMRTDPIVQASESTPESSDVLNLVMGGLAEEAAALRFERMEAERNGVESSQISVRRIGALKALGDAWIKRKEQVDSKTIDIESPAFEKLFKLISETFMLAMQEAGVSPELAESVFSNLSKKLNDESWATEARSRMKE